LIIIVPFKKYRLQQAHPSHVAKVSTSIKLVNQAMTVSIETIYFVKLCHFCQNSKINAKITQKTINIFKTCPSRFNKRLGKTIKTLKQKAQNSYPNHS
jgi:hypothetical protein